MRTSVSLGGIGAWLDGGLDTPELVLGPREIEHNGRRALSVRAFLPDSRQAWLIDGGHGAGAALGRPGRGDPARRRRLDSARPKTLARGGTGKFDDAHCHHGRA